jgi:hypothetical protein
MGPYVTKISVILFVMRVVRTFIVLFKITAADFLVGPFKARHSLCIYLVQGTLNEGEDSVHLTSKYLLV